MKLLNIVAASGNVSLFEHLTCRGAIPRLSRVLHRASKCQDYDKSIATIHYLLDEHNMNINTNNEDLRNVFDRSTDTGTPLNCAFF
jgi:hypothetical protein